MYYLESTEGVEMGEVKGLGVVKDSCLVAWGYCHCLSLCLINKIRANK